MFRMPARLFGVVSAAALAAGVVSVTTPAAARNPSERGPAQHVLLLSVDGLHQTDLAWDIKQHPDSALAKLAGHGVQFTNAQTPVPSDSFPGIVAQATGGN